MNDSTDERIRDAFTPRRVRIQEAAAELGRTNSRYAGAGNG